VFLSRSGERLSREPALQLSRRKVSRIAAVAVSAATVLAVSTAAGATSFGGGSGNSTVPADSLRALASKIGLGVGNAVNMDLLNVDKTYTSIVANQYNTVTPENVMKWDTIEPTQGQLNFGPADALVKFAQQHGQLVRGHTLMWHNQLPSWLTAGVSDGTISNAQLREILKKHITDEVSHFRGEIWQWDVANEFFTDSTPSMINPNDFWISHLGTGVIADAFRWAHAADPHALLFYNDYNIAGEDGSNAKADAVYAMVTQLKKQGVPIDGVGDQGHLDTQYGFSGTRMHDDLQRCKEITFEREGRSPNHRGGLPGLAHSGTTGGDRRGPRPRAQAHPQGVRRVHELGRHQLGNPAPRVPQHVQRSAALLRGPRREEELQLPLPDGRVRQLERQVHDTVLREAARRRIQESREAARHGEVLSPLQGAR